MCNPEQRHNLVNSFLYVDMLLAVNVTPKVQERLTNPIGIDTIFMGLWIAICRFCVFVFSSFMLQDHLLVVSLAPVTLKASSHLPSSFLF